MFETNLRQLRSANLVSASIAIALVVQILVFDIVLGNEQPRDIQAPDNISEANFINSGEPLTSTLDLQLQITASDDTEITAYLVRDNNTGMEPVSPDAHNSDWVEIEPDSELSMPVNYVVAGDYSNLDNIFVYVWMKDAAGNISNLAIDDIQYVAQSTNGAFAATTTIPVEDFESGLRSWFADQGVWEVGTPTVGPDSCSSGDQCAGTVLNGDYPMNTDSRLVSPAIILPDVADPKEVIRLRFNHWFSYGNVASGIVQVQTFDNESGTWSDFISLGNSIVNLSSVWTPDEVDLTPLAGETVRIAFFHSASIFETEAGWYIDDINIVVGTPTFSSDFESGWEDWFADRGVWEVGTPTVGPDSCNSGDQCAGTVLNGDYPMNTDSRLVSPAIILPDVADSKEVMRLRFNHWFSYGNVASGIVQVQTFDNESGTWSDFISLGNSFVNLSSVWTPYEVDLTPLAGETVRIAFFHSASIFETEAGWYIDDINIVVGRPTFSGDFESGWEDWFADRGVWEVGTPTVGPDSCNSGDQCAGTVLSGDYPMNTDSRLMGPIVHLPELIGPSDNRLRFSHWFSYGTSASGIVQAQTWDDESLTWSDWEPVGNEIIAVSQTWSQVERNLKPFAGMTVRIAFFHSASIFQTDAGWYIDDVRLILIGTPGDDVLDLSGIGSAIAFGETGDDTFIVDDKGDEPTEFAGGGTDTVQSSVTWILGDYLENLQLTQSEQIDGTGNELENVIQGNDSSNVLDGREGADTMIGGIGSDTYFVDDVDDEVIEVSNTEILGVEALGVQQDFQPFGSGDFNDLDLGDEIDEVISTINYVLTDFVENLTLDGTANIDGTGNELNNEIIGNSGSNLLSSGDGNDILIGGEGNDVLDGEDGTDIAVFGGNFADYEIDESDGVLRVTDGNSADGNDGADVLFNIEILRFADGDQEIVPEGPSAEIVDPDNDGALWNSSILVGETEISASQSQLFRAYSGALGRTPDDEGYNWWLDQIEQGKHTLQSMSANFIDSIEFRGGADTDGDGNVSDDEFLNHMYLGVFGRPPDQGGYDFWIGQLNSNTKTQADVLVGMTQSNEYVHQTVDAAVDYLVRD